MTVQEAISICFDILNGVGKRGRKGNNKNRN